MSSRPRSTSCAVTAQTGVKYSASSPGCRSAASKSAAPGPGQPDAGRSTGSGVAGPSGEGKDVPRLIAGDDRPVVQVLRLPRSDHLGRFRRVALADFFPRVDVPIARCGGRHHMEFPGVPPHAGTAGRDGTQFHVENQSVAWPAHAAGPEARRGSASGRELRRGDGAEHNFPVALALVEDTDVAVREARHGGIRRAARANDQLHRPASPRCPWRG